MSEVKVNKISPRTNCGTVTVGDSGDSVTVTAGVPVTINGDLKSNALKAVDGGSIISQCGTTITLGASGDTINLAAGATQTGFGRTGTVDWDTTAKTASFTAVLGNGYFVNTTSGVITVTLPAGSAGDIVSLADYAATWQTNNVTVTPNGTDKIGGVNSSVTLNTEGQSVTFVYTDSTQGWLNTMDSTSNVRGNDFIIATGGTITTCGNYKIHTFTGPGTFCVSSVGTPSNANIDYLVLAGGGSGGTRYSGGGGAGGYRESQNPTTSGCWSASPLATCASLPVSASPYPITVGGGGAGTTCLGDPTSNLPGNRGSNSIFSTITSTGGGGGIGQGTTAPSAPLSPGGSGGGGSYNPSFGAGNTPPVSPSQGNNGGSGIPGPNYSVGGGGGAGSVGGNGGPSTSGTGGSGVSSSITGSSVTRAGGGGGGASQNFPVSAGPGGPGGGTTGGSSPGSTTTAGETNKGAGSGGAYGYPGNSGNGGSGIVIIRYKYQ